MNGKKLYLPIFLLIALSCSSGSNENEVTFTNPVTDIDWADPTVWKENGVFYTISTGVGAILSSKDLVNWTDTGMPVLSEEALSCLRSQGRYFWAPDVRKISDNYLLYLTCYNANVDCGIYVLESKSPSGPFEYVGNLTHSKLSGIKDTIDAEVMEDENGRLWLFYGSIDGIHRVELNPDGKRMIEGGKIEKVAGLQMDINPERDKVFEGCYLHRHKGWWYMFVSAGRYNDESYRIKVGRSRTLEGMFTDKDGKAMLQGNATDLLVSKEGDDFFGPGHNAEIFTDDCGQDWILYHCHQKSKEADYARYLCLQRVFWGKDGWPYFKDGTVQPKDKAPVFKSAGKKISK